MRCVHLYVSTDVLWRGANAASRTTQNVLYTDIYNAHNKLVYFAELGEPQSELISSVKEESDLV